MAYEDRLMESERAGNYLDTVTEPYGGIDEVPLSVTDYGNEAIGKKY